MKQIFLLFIFLSSITNAQSKINGISFVASNRVVTDKNISPVIDVNANWVTLMPFAFMKTTADTSIIYNDKRQWWGERIEGIEKTSELFHAKKIKIMLKPQIWIPDGFTGNIAMKNNADWLVLEKNYEKFILEYAQIAQKNNFEMFCMGTELNAFVKARPKFWKQLIKKIKNVYSGKITYAENWDTYDNVPFWNQLDFIGVDAYFPLSNKKTPTIDELSLSWNVVKQQLKSLSERSKKPILFTEFGYQSKDFTAQEPWNHNQSSDVNLVGQQNSLAVLLATFWREDWFAGGFLWKWYDNHDQVGGTNDTDYTPQNKPAELILKKFYGEYRN